MGAGRILLQQAYHAVRSPNLIMKIQADEVKMNHIPALVHQIRDYTSTAQSEEVDRAHRLFRSGMPPETALEELAQQTDATKRLNTIWADGSYRDALIAWVAEHFELVGI